MLKYSFIFFSLTFLISATLCAVNPTVREFIRKKVYSDRKVISSATGYLLGNNTRVKALKIREHNNLVMEVYSNISYSETPNLIGRFPLELSKDAYFNFKGVSTNLAFDDVDEDGKLELIVPGFDRHLTAKVSVYKFDQNVNAFFKSTDYIHR